MNHRNPGDSRFGHRRGNRWTSSPNDPTSTHPGQPPAEPPHPGEQHPNEQHVNEHSPNEQSRAGQPLDEQPLDEQALRRMLQGAVENLEPADDALEHLRRAVPARRTRRRQALGGAVAAVVLIGAAVPALMHVADTVGVGGSDDRPANAANSHRHAEETVGDEGHRGGTADPARPGGGDTAARGEHRVEQPSGDSDAPRTSREPSRPRDSVGSASPTPGVTLSAAAPTCDRDQLGKGSGSVGAADAAGRVYGAFRIVNVSRASCAVTGPGELVAQTGGGSQKARVSVVDHTTGDPAAGLPDPEHAPSAVVLRPGQAYVVKFAWVPTGDGGASGCTKTGGSTTPPPAAGAPTGTGGGRVAEAPAVSPSPSSPAVVPPATPAPPAPTGSVTLTNTPVAGEPAAAEARIPDACAGTVYHTGPLPAAAPTA
ncbi:DUF4232 domain-containing protein [Streptomyces huiliensis]|uniref:DUF4232 domain-containing protein n=1 Tax=Streptomyces huiliensis TaxID=2876027 RepID=UPI001CBF2D4A|nr:DUF4232 domain-containing protein [Streptomyces huiliensis]MBZ4318176.1 DUF4232 domain-containing protein [Streptomyces huiliensis]